MATSDNLPEGTLPVPSTYPNPLANNINMHRFPASPGVITTKQNDPILINGAKGSAFDAHPEEPQVPEEEE